MGIIVNRVTELHLKHAYFPRFGSQIDLLKELLFCKWMRAGLMCQRGRDRRAGGNLQSEATLSSNWCFHGKAWRQDCFFFFRPSCNFLELSLRFLLYYYHSLDSFSVIPISDRTNGHSVATVQPVLSRWRRYARTHAQDAAQHTCRHVKSVRFICTLSDEGIIASPGWGTGSPPFCILLRVPKWGGGNRAGHTLVKVWGRRVPPRRPSLWKEICSSAERLDSGGRNPCYL